MAGSAVGFVVAVGALLLDVQLNQRGFTPSGLLSAHADNPALWVTALMPIQLGVLAWALTRSSPTPPPEPSRKRTPAGTRPRMVPATQLEQAEKAREEAVRASHSKSLFLASMSHELRTPLNAIIGYSEMMREDVDAGMSAEPADLVRVSTAARHLLQLINNILDLSKIGAGKMSVVLEPVIVNALFEEVSATVGPLATKNGNTFKTEIRERIHKVQGDHMRLRQVLINLLGNAFKFTKDGTVTLSVDVESQDGFEWALFQVTDTGIGMTATQIERLFSEYAQADSGIKREFGGTGLGLSISQRLSEMMGGRIEVESVAGKGSTFTLRLPLPEQMKVTPARLRSMRGLRVLVMDDDPVIETVLRRLRREGVDVHAVRTADDGRELAAGQEFDVIVLDVQLGGSEGWKLLEELGKGHVPVVVASVEDDFDRRNRFGTAAFVQKPVDYDGLLAAIQRAPRN